MTPTSRLTALRSGVTLPYVAQGDPSGTPVVFLHGYTDSWRSFEGVLAHLPRSVRAFAVTQRGHGDADRPETGYHPDDFVADVEAFMDAVGLRSATIVGHSMGSLIARRFAARHPERVDGLVLMASFYKFDDNLGLLEFRDAVAGFEDPVDPDFVRQFQLDNLARPVAEALVDMAVGESLKLPARLWGDILGALVDDDDADELGRIEAPTLVVWGDQDLFSPRADQDAIVAAIPDAELVVYPGAGHAFQWEDPAEFVVDLTAFLKTVTERAIVGR